MLKKLLSSLTFIAFIMFSISSAADWGSVLDDLTTTGQKALSDNTVSSSALNYDTIVAGLKEALDKGTRYAVDNVSQTDGYLSNELIRITMPPELEQASGLMRSVGLSDLADEFEQSINHAAEKAAPQATDIIVGAISEMNIEDANAILQGPDDAATQYLKTHTNDQLTTLFRPSIESSLNQVGSTQYYDELTTQIAAVPFVGENINLDLPNYVTEQALDGLFVMIAEQEKLIRDDPAARTTDLLKQVFK